MKWLQSSSPNTAIKSKRSACSEDSFCKTLSSPCHAPLVESMFIEGRDECSIYPHIKEYTSEMRTYAPTASSLPPWKYCQRSSNSFFGIYMVTGRRFAPEPGSAMAAGGAL